MRIPLWWWRMRYPEYFRRCEKGYWWLDEAFTEDLGFRRYVRIAHTLRRYQPSPRYYAPHLVDFEAYLFLRLYGTEYASPTLEENLELIEDGLLQRDGYCFANSLEMGTIMKEAHPHLSVRYAEGIAVNPTGAHLHGWLVVNGRVIDLTWSDSFLTRYFGVEFSLSAARTILCATGWYGIFQQWDEERGALVKKVLDEPMDRKGKGR